MVWAVKKCRNYGYRFIKEIISFSKEKREKKSRKKGNTYQLTYELYREGLSPKEISLKRNLALPTVFSHLAKLYETGKEIDLHQYISTTDLQAVKKAKKELENPAALKTYFEHFEEAIDYGSIRLALSILQKEEGA